MVERRLPTIDEAFPAKIGPDGKKLRECRFCGGPLPKHKRKWCGQSCQEAALLQTNWNFIRVKVFERDRGVCALCGADTEKILGDIQKHRRESADLSGRATKAYAAFMHGKRGLAWPNSLWQMDHRIPLAEGGHPTDLDNLRTLCTEPCHKKETAKLAARLAIRRRKAGLKPFFPEYALPEFEPERDRGGDD